MSFRFQKPFATLVLVLLSLSAFTAITAQKRVRPEPLPKLLRHQVAMWIVTNEEFHPETVVPYIAPPIPYEGRRDFFIFTDRGGDKLERIALVRYLDEHLRPFFEVLNPPGREIQATLKKVVEERNPKTIALNFGGTRGATNGLTYDAYKFLAETLGKEYVERFVPAAPLIV